MTTLLEIPEVAGLDTRQHLVRIPPELDVPLTGRVRAIIDAPECRRLARISQLGLVSLVYPAAIHTRFEHSLGVYRLALKLLERLGHDSRFTEVVSPRDAELLIVTALLHDVGHWPFCHPLEDMRLESILDHELLAASFLQQGEVADVLRGDWGIDPGSVIALLNKKPGDQVSQLLSSVLSGPIDIDKMDYLFRDSLHAGVPYGRHFDQQRLTGSFCLNENGNGLAITDKGKTAAELMVFARYVMFSEVYWHHGVRSATAMLQRAFFRLHDSLDLDSMFRMTEAEMIAEFRHAAGDGPAAALLDGLFGPTRRLYKRVAQYSFFEDADLYHRMSGRPYPWLADCAGHFAGLAGAALRREIAPDDVLFDAPPAQREVEFNVDVYYPKQECYRRLDEVSPVVRALAQEQFDDYVKRVRIFADAGIAADLRSRSDLADLVSQAIDRTG